MTKLVLAQSPLLSVTGGKRQFTVHGSTVDEVIRSFCDQYSGLSRFIYASDGHVKQYIQIFVNGQSIRDLQGMNTPVQAEDTVLIMMALAGG